jgi:hypothetical protein
MSRNRPPDSGRRAQPVSAPKIDTPVLIVSMLTLFFASLFATLLLLRPETSDPIELAPISAPPVDAPPVSAPPPEPVWQGEPKPAPTIDPALRAQLEQLGVKCAEGANCFPD